jgi:serine/threonine-protein kinase
LRDNVCNTKPRATRRQTQATPKEAPVSDEKNDSHPISQEQEPAPVPTPVHAAEDSSRYEDVVPVSQNSEDAVEDADATVVRDVDAFGPDAEGIGQAPLPREVPGEGKSRRRGRALLALAIVAGIAACLVAAATYGAELWGGKVVPYVVGYTQARATARLEQKGFAVRVRKVASDADAGTVTATDPKAGQRRDAGSTVTVSVATPRTVPDVTGKTLAAAKAALRKAGARNFSIAYVASDAEQGTVVATSPAAGAQFASSDEVTIKVAQPYTVPYVVGKDEDAAKSAVAEAGLTASVAYVESSEDAGTVVAADPAPGTTIQKGATVTLQVSSPFPSDYRHLRDYFDCVKRVTEYLKTQSFSIASSGTGDDGSAEVLYTSADKGNITVGSRPFSHSFATGSSTDDVLASGAPMRGIRLDFAASDIPQDASGPTEADAQHLADLCVFTGASQMLTEANATLPSDLTKTSARFVCVYGTMGDYSWSVLVVSEGGSVRASATCAPTSLYDDYDLSKFGNSICDMIACVDVYE